MLAGKLRVGEPVQEADGATAIVVRLHVVPGAASMWDLTVSTVHDFAVGAGAFVVHNCGKVDYGSTDLSQAVQDRRKADVANFGADVGKRGNYGAARLDDGSIITGRSGGGLHAEQDLLKQASDQGKNIVELYSEREPCASRCGPILQSQGITNISWSWDWNGVDRDAINQSINEAVRGLFTGP